MSNCLDQQTHGSGDSVGIQKNTSKEDLAVISHLMKK
jgi:hypothetical protein